jgi:5-methyltetrahydrofolate corrinoid/iron sulfur protein methyltransferase
MFVIASNITTRNSQIREVFQRAAENDWRTGIDELSGLAEECFGVKCDTLEINLQQHFDVIAAMRYAVNAVQKNRPLQLCLSSNDASVIEAGLTICNQPPIVNYISYDKDRLLRLLPVAAKYQASVVLLINDLAHPSDAHEMLQKTAILVGAANEVGITNDRIFIDPGLVHITSEYGQRHLVQIIEFLSHLPEIVEPPVNSTCWLANSSAGSNQRTRAVIETTLLSFLAGAGLSSVFMDVLKPENQRALRMVKIFRNELIYSSSETSL